jgi:uncharacterized protein YbjT (DUF2867 family)
VLPSATTSARVVPQDDGWPAATRKPLIGREAGRPELSAPTPPPVLVTGATGRIGRMAIDRLVELGVQVRALVRQPDTASMPPGVEVVVGDLTDPSSLDPALDGAGAVFLVWTAPPSTAPAVVERLAARVPRVVFLSAPHQTPHPFFAQPNPMAELYAEIERRIGEAGLTATIIRPGMFASNALNWWAPTIRARGTIRWPFLGAETAPVDDRDVAAVVASALADEDRAGGDYVLTGPQSLSQRAQIEIIGEVIGWPVSVEELTPDEFRGATGNAWPRAAVEMLLAAWGATMGIPAYLTSDVADILGTPARSFREWVSDNASAFSSSVD